MKNTNLKDIFRSLNYRNYRLFFSGQFISLIGTWMQQIAMSWLVYRLTNSAFLLGAVGFVGQMPAFLMTPFAGVFADRWNRRKVLVITQTLAMIQALILAVLVLTHTVAVWQIVLLQVCLGLVNAFDIPVRQSFVVQMVEKKEDLGNAIALNSSMVNGARLIGPSIAGVLIATVGEGVCFLVNGLSYIAVIIALLAMKIPKINKASRTTKVLEELKGGFKYAFGHAQIRYVIVLLALVSLIGMPYAVLMPIFAREVLAGGPHTFGFLIGLSGVGALIGALYLASLKNAAGLEKVIVTGAAIFGTGLIAFSFSRVLWLSMILMLFVGFGMMVQMAGSNTFLQTIVHDDKRGRIMSFYTMAFMGMAPFGSLLAGWLASIMGAPKTIMAGGILCIVGALLFLRKLKVFKTVES